MRRLAGILALVNCATLAWLIATAQRELPPWKKPLHDAKATISDIQPATDLQELELRIARQHIDTAESWTSMVFDEYREAEHPLLGLAVLNCICLLIMALKSTTLTATTPPLGKSKV